MAARKAKTPKPTVTYTYQYEPETESVHLYFSDQAEPDKESLHQHLYFGYTCYSPLKDHYEDEYDNDDILAIAEAALPEFKKWIEKNPLGNRDVMHARMLEILEETVYWIRDNACMTSNRPFNYEPS